MAGPGMLRPNSPGLKLCELSEYVQRGVRGSGETGVSQDRGSSSRYGEIPPSPMAQSCPSARPHQAREGKPVAGQLLWGQGR